MKTKTIAVIGIIAGGLSLSLELFMLKIIQLIDSLQGGFWGEIWHYAIQFPLNIALLITILVIIASLYLLCRKTLERFFKWVCDYKNY